MSLTAGWRPLIPAAAIIAVSFGSATAASADRPTASQLAHALTVGSGAPVQPADVRVRRCGGPKEEPTEFECFWSQRIGGEWRRFRSWLAIDGSGWQFIDWPPTRD